MFGSVLSGAAQTALAVLGESGLVKNAYLAGGSALALHYGHRYSIDFDFFSTEPFLPDTLSRRLQNLGIFKETFSKGISLIGSFNGIKMSYFQYEYPLIAPTTEFLHVTVAHPHDIGAMKLTAIMDRGTKRDLVDLYELHEQGVTVEQLFDMYDKKYQKLSANMFSLIKALGYFDETELSTMPEMIRAVSWEEVKQFFSAESLRLAKKYLEP